MRSSLLSILALALAACSSDPASECGECERACCAYDFSTGMTVAPFCPPERYECSGPPIRDAGPRPDAP